MVRTNRKFKDKTMIVEFEIDEEKKGRTVSIQSSKNLEECFKQLIGFTSFRMRSRSIKQAFAGALKEWGIKY